MVGRILAVAALLSSLGCRQLLGFEEVVTATPEDSASPDPDVPEVEPDAMVLPPPDVNVAPWPFRKPLTIDGEQITGTLSGFPLLVRLPADSDLAASARDDGFDLVFTAADGTTALSYERERFDQTTGALVAWVRMPTLSAGTDVTIYLYFGNPNATDQQDASAVWDSNFVGVWHLGETAGTTIADSTSANRDGTKVAATTPAAAASVIGGGQQFGGTTDGIAIGNAAALDIASITFETWIQVPSCAGDIYRRIIDFTVAFASSWALAYPCAGAPIVNDNSVILDLPDGSKVQTPTNSLSIDVPHHLVLETNPTKFFFDGVEVASSAAPFGLAQNNVATIIGNREGSVDRAVIGTLDEVRISRVRRSSNYIATSHASQRPGSTMVSVGPVEAVP